MGCHSLFSNRSFTNINVSLHRAQSIPLKPCTSPSLLPLSTQHIHSYLNLLWKNRNHMLLPSSAFIYSTSHFLCIFIHLQLLPSLPLQRKFSSMSLKELRLTLPCVSLWPPFQGASIFTNKFLISKQSLLPFHSSHPIDVLKSIPYLVTLLPFYHSLYNSYMLCCGPRNSDIPMATKTNRFITKIWRLYSYQLKYRH